MKKTSLEIFLLNIIAEKRGFEPPVRFNPDSSLAGIRFKPLSHFSTIISNNFDILPYFDYFCYNYFMKKKHIYLASDHAGFEHKEEVREILKNKF